MTINITKINHDDFALFITIIPFDEYGNLFKEARFILMNMVIF